MQLITDLRRRRRGFVLHLSLVVAMLSVVTSLTVRHLLSPDPALDPIDLAREWGALVLLALPWAAAVLFVRQSWRHFAGHPRADHSIRASIRALLDENRLSRIRVKVVALLHGLVLLVLPVVVFQLRAVGKAGDEILVPAFVLWPLLAAGIGGALWYHDRKKLLPRKRELEALLGAYE
ncbi:MAG: hypothetical protein JNL92_16035 [Opitutaceae bacterium]|nr:hypothetical protein [Opitutaceae bacterium]